jgi:hypothetical protein
MRRKPRLEAMGERFYRRNLCVHALRAAALFSTVGAAVNQTLSKEMIMKQLVVAVALALAAAPALADDRFGPPYDQSEIDRMLPVLPESAGTASVAVSRDRMPYDQVEIDRALPTLPDATERVQLAQFGGGSYNSPAEEGSESPWANDYHFIAPAQ